MKHHNFLILSKALYLSDIHPFDLIKIRNEPLNRIIELGKELIIEQGLQKFLELLLENQYYVNLWAAMIALDHGNPKQNDILNISGKDTVIDHCIETIERHLSFQTTIEQENNGKDWLKKIQTYYNR